MNSATAATQPWPQGDRVIVPDQRCKGRYAINAGNVIAINVHDEKRGAGYDRQARDVFAGKAR